MSFFSTIGKEVRGLLGGDQFFDNMARAQAFAHGDYEAAHRIGGEIRRRRSEKSAAPPAAPLVSEQAEGGTAARDLPYPSLPGLVAGISQPRFHVPPAPFDVGSWATPGGDFGTGWDLGYGNPGFRRLFAGGR